MKCHLVAIVDPYSSGALLAPEFKRHGCMCVMVQSSDRIPAIYRRSLRHRDFLAIVQHADDEERTVADLQRMGVQFIIAGCELGVELADRLSERLNLNSNRTRLSTARRDKSLMAETVRKAGLRTPEQFRSDRLDALADWARRGRTWPVIVKPANSTGSDGVRLCNSEEDLGSAYDNIMRKQNLLGLRNDAVLVQEFLDGTEYVVDTVSLDGCHRVATFWKYGKPPPEVSLLGYDSIEILPYDGEIQHQLFDYVGRVLDALGIRYGAAHCEVMWVSGAPVLVEVNARLIGGILPQISRMCSGTSQVTLTVEACLESDRYLRNLGQPYELKNRGALHFLMRRQPGRLKAFQGLAEIRSLRSFHELHVRERRGEAIPRVLGWVTLLHSDTAVLHDDLARIRRLEDQGLYTVEKLESAM